MFFKIQLENFWTKKILNEKFWQKTIFHFQVRFEETYNVLDTCKRSMVARESIPEDLPFAGRHAMGKRSSFWTCTGKKFMTKAQIFLRLVIDYEQSNHYLYYNKKKISAHIILNYNIIYS